MRLSLKPAALFELRYGLNPELAARCREAELKLLMGMPVAVQRESADDGARQ